MRINFITSQLPELAQLNDSYRRYVLDRARLLVRREAPPVNYAPILFCFLVGFCGWLGGAYLCVSLFSGDRMLLSLFGSQSGAWSGGVLGGWIGAALLRSRLRSSVRRILHDDDISISQTA